jgi:nicotinamide mononucleotide transporter
MRNRKPDDKSSVVVKFLTNKQRVGIALGVLGTIFIYRCLLVLLHGNLTWLDSATTMIQVIAMILMIGRYMEQWVLWIVLNVLQITMWSIVMFKQGNNDMAMLMMWSAYFVNSIYGLASWIKMYQAQELEMSPMERAGKALSKESKYNLPPGVF